MRLHKLGKQHNTDKSYLHGYLDYYQGHLQTIKDKKIRFLEVGIHMGDSLRMWEEYFQNGEIIGADIDDKSDVDGGRIKTYKVDQTKPDQLRSIPGNFDVIVDDGGHTMEQQQVTLSVLMDKLNSGGTYILEDLQTSSVQYVIDERKRTNINYLDWGATLTNNTYNLLKDIINNNMTGDYYVSNEEFIKLVSEIKSIDFLDKNEGGSITSIIIKN